MLYKNSLKRILIKLPGKLRAFLIRNFPENFFPPYMSKEEFHLFEKHVQNSNSVVEFGAGGSTTFFLKKGKSVYSVESDKSFYDFLNTFPLIRKKIKDKSLQFYYVNIGETGGWGKPKDESRRENWSAYYLQVWENESKRNPDIVFIDGRFRVMCALSAIPFIKKETKVIIHDFSVRKEYEIVLDFYDVIDQVDSMVILQVKENVDKEKLDEIKKRYKYDFK